MSSGVRSWLTEQDWDLSHGFLGTSRGTTCPGCSSALRRSLGTKAGHELVRCPAGGTVFVGTLPPAEAAHDYTEYYSEFNLVVPEFVERRSDEGHPDAGREPLRIFTARSVLAMLAGHGLTVDTIARNSRRFDDQSQIGRVGTLATRVAVATLARWPLRELLAYQYVVLARRAR